MASLIVIGGHFNDLGRVAIVRSQQSAGGVDGESGGIVVGMAAFIRMGDDDVRFEAAEVAGDSVDKLGKVEGGFLIDKTEEGYGEGVGVGVGRGNR